MMDEKPLVSVIVPVYNAEQYLCECLDSILASSLWPIEIIVVDDGSTDTSSRILEEYANKPGIRVLHQANAGPSRARNTGLKAAQGEYVGFVDADDWIESKMFETMYQSAKENQADIVFCGIFRNKANKTQSALSPGVYEEQRIAEVIYPKLICNLDSHSGQQTLRGSVCCRLFRRKLIVDNLLFFNEALFNNEDMLFCLKATLAAKCYVCIKDYLYHNRTPQGTLTRKYQPQMWERQQTLIQELKTIGGSTCYDFSKQIDKKIFQIVQYSIYFDAAFGTPLSLKEQVQRVKQITESSVFNYALQRISFDSLKPIERVMSFAFHFHLYRLARWLILYRSSKRQ